MLSIGHAACDEPDTTAVEVDWPQFRGPDGQGHSSARELPLMWSETENVAWKVAVPGLGWSSPVIHDGKIWLTTAIDDGRSLRAISLDQRTGRLLHDVEVFAIEAPGRVHDLNSHATPTPVVEGNRLYVHFGGNGTACLTTDGAVVWKVNLEHQSYYGPSSTPVLCDDLLIVPCQGTDTRYTAALDKRTGEIRWKQPHTGRNSESTPLVIETPAGRQLVNNLADRVVAYDPRTGSELSSVAQGDNFAQVPRPVYGCGLVFVGGGYFSPLVQAIRPDGRGDVTASHVVWSVRDAVPQNPSPLIVDDEVYLFSDKGIGSCHDAPSGELHWRERLGKGGYASPLSAGGRIYFWNDDGETIVVAAGRKFQKLAANQLDGRTFASPAVADRALYVRTDTHLYRIEKPSEFVPATPDEPLAKEFSLERAARALDASALAWQSKQQCCQCHANFMYLIARPALAKIVEPPAAVREMYESLVGERWEKQGLRYPSEAMVVSVPLALNDRQTSRSLHLLTRRALDRMLTYQRIDGGWDPIGGSARTFINEFEETLFAALGVATAPDDYAKTPAAQTALALVREYVKNHPPNTPFQKGLLLWVAWHVDGLVDEADRLPMAETFLSLQADDGGWAIENLVAGSFTFEEFRVDRGRPSNGYGTGFAIFAASKAGIPAADRRLQRGIAWLKANQRASGRWFTPTLSIGTRQNLPSNSGTALAVLALQACGEIDGDGDERAMPYVRFEQ